MATAAEPEVRPAQAAQRPWPPGPAHVSVSLFGSCGAAPPRPSGDAPRAGLPRSLPDTRSLPRIPSRPHPWYLPLARHPPGPPASPGVLSLPPHPTPVHPIGTPFGLLDA